jgi:hypothetical protein
MLTSKEIEQSENLTHDYGSGRGPTKLVYLDAYPIYPDKFIVAVLDTMWDWKQQTSSAGYKQAPRYFRINPNNFTGRRLYRLVGKAKLLVTDSCPELVSNPKQHGTPDPQWLSDNLFILNDLRRIDLILVCGKVAQRTIQECPSVPNCSQLAIPHPAARTWTKAQLDETAKKIEDLTNP